jgi:UDP-glucose 4-epimerase
MTVLVTGGAGYVGSHTVKAMREIGIPCVILDNLVRGYRELALDAKVIVGDTADSRLVRRILDEHQVTAVMHFAAYAYVGESVEKPAMYYENNVAATVHLLKTTVESGIKRFVFSSTCATYGMPETVPMTEEHPQRPVNPYGASKLMVERVLQDFDRAYDLKSVVLRYFNAAGADPSGRIGERHDPETHLVPLTLQVAAGLRDSVTIYGTDYATDDGTCVRDYIHVTDLAQAHILGLRSLEAGNPSDVFNLGNGNGFSVRQVVNAAARVTGRRIKTTEGPRRAGDPPMLVGSSAKAKRALGWMPRFETLEAILDTAWRWHKTTVPGLGRGA